MKPKLGDWVRFNRRIEKRHRLEIDPDRSSAKIMRLSWEPVSLYLDSWGLVAGVRVVQEGTVIPGYEDVPSYLAASKYLTAYLVATDIRSKHVLVRPEDVLEIGERPEKLVGNSSSETLDKHA